MRRNEMGTQLSAHFEGANEGIFEDFLGIEDLDLHDTVKQLLRAFFKVEEQHLVCVCVVCVCMCVRVRVW